MCEKTATNAFNSPMPSSKCLIISPNGSKENLAGCQPVEFLSGPCYLFIQQVLLDTDQVSDPMSGIIYAQMIKTFWVQAACHLIEEPDEWIKTQEEMLVLYDSKFWMGQWRMKKKVVICNMC